MKPLLLILLIVLSSCTTTREHTFSATKNKVNAVVDNSKIIFLNFKVTKTLDKTLTASLINKIIAEGQLKKNIKQETVAKLGDLECAQLDKNLKTINRLKITNPLVKNIEYIEASGEFGRKTIVLDSTTFSVRMQLNTQTKFITLKTLNNPNTNLLKIEL